ncbi:MAG: cyclopropane-fatty-acyl-phospholipid synthase family protein [Burkholderiaceae bacterium]|nr:cyclopropane-fatty-acyl-phospholipid synthase family protein [Burkholderiaceae bacterium]
MSQLAFDARAGLDTARFPADARLALRLLERMRHGRLDVTFPDGQHAYFGDLRSAERADLQLANWNLIRAALRSGDIGFAESYIDGDWNTHDLVRLLEFFIANRTAAEDVIYGSFIGRLAYRLRHLLNRNTRAQARRNIHAHYDLGNAFYGLWLDPTMTYSSALFAQRADPHAVASPSELVEAQHAKYARVLDELELPASAQLLEIGCGWGGLAEAAARRGHAVTGLTLSTEQLAYAQARLQRAGFDADLRLQDYRDHHGQYDGVASIEMFEAVGEAYWASYFATLRRCLKPGARACLQTIVIDDALFERYRRGTDFIQQYIFPGGMLPSPAVRALGFDQRFVRIWDFYLAYCEAAFARENTDVIQYTLVAR